MQWYLEVWRKYAVFEGRASRREYWWFQLFNLIVFVVLTLIDAFGGLMINGLGILSTLYALAAFLPSLAVAVRRLHDIDFSGWWVLIGFIPLIGPLVMLAFMIMPGTEGPNRFGPPPA